MKILVKPNRDVAEDLLDKGVKYCLGKLSFPDAIKEINEIIADLNAEAKKAESPKTAGFFHDGDLLQYPPEKK